MSARRIVGLLAALSLIAGCGSANDPDIEPVASTSTTDTAVLDRCHDLAVVNFDILTLRHETWERLTDGLEAFDFDGAEREYGHMMDLVDAFEIGRGQMEHECDGTPGFAELRASWVVIDEETRAMRAACREIDLGWDC